MAITSPGGVTRGEDKKQPPLLAVEGEAPGKRTDTSTINNNGSGGAGGLRTDGFISVAREGSSTGKAALPPSTTGGRSSGLFSFFRDALLEVYDQEWRERARAHFRRSLEGAPDDPLWGPIQFPYLLMALWSALLLVGSVVASAHVILSGGIVLLWFFTPASTLILCIQKRICWPYTFAVIVSVDFVAVSLGHGRISRDTVAAFILIFVDLANIAVGTLLLRPLVASSIYVVRTSPFVRYLVAYVLIITPAFSLINGGIIVLLPSNNINWLGGRQLIVAWLLGDFFATYFTVYAVLVFRHTIAQATQDTYRVRDLFAYLQQRLSAGGFWLKLRLVEFAGMLIITYMVAHAVATSSSSIREYHLGPRIASRLMFPLLGLVTFRFGQFGSCVALIVASAGIFTVTYGQLDRGDRLTDIFYQIDLLLGPILVVLITWSMTFLAVALAEKQDGLSLLEQRNYQLLVQGRELQQAKLEAQRALSTKTEFFARVSHEFRTPLNIILGFAEEIKRQELSPYVEERIGYIITSGESLLRIVDDILELFRLSSNRLQIDESVVDIHSYFMTLCDLVQVITDKNQRRLERVLDPSLPRYVLLDKIRFSQLIMNLSSNAAKFTGTGGRIVLRLKEGRAGGRKGRKGVLVGAAAATAAAEAAAAAVGAEGGRDGGREGGMEGVVGRSTTTVATVDVGMSSSSSGSSSSSSSSSGSMSAPSLSLGSGATAGKGSSTFSLLPSLPGSSNAHIPTTSKSSNSRSGSTEQPNPKLPKEGGKKKGPLVAAGKGRKGGRKRHRVIWLRLEVEDDGIGIPQSTQDQIFNCFFSGNQQSGGEKGHGLGLAITKELVDLMKGTIEVASEVGVGSMFTVDLPVRVVEVEGEGGKEGRREGRRGPGLSGAGVGSAVAAVAAVRGGGGLSPPLHSPGGAIAPLTHPLPSSFPPFSDHVSTSSNSNRDRNPSLPPSLPSNRRLQGLKIMAVEDLLPNQMVLGGMLREDAHHVQFVETAFGALEMLSRHPGHFDVVLLDIELPDAHGVTVLTRIRSHPSPRIAAMPVVVVTAVAMDGERNRCFRHGADDFVTKPIRLATLRASLLALYVRGRLKAREGLVVVEDGGGRQAARGGGRM